MNATNATDCIEDFPVHPGKAKQELLPYPRTKKGLFLAQILRREIEISVLKNIFSNTLGRP